MLNDKPINSDEVLTTDVVLDKTSNCVRLLRQRGASLVEVVVSVLIFVGGAVAVVGMQNHAMKTTHDALQRSQAIWMLNAAVELMRLNPDGLQNGYYQDISTRVVSDMTTYCSNLVKQCIGSTCSSEEMAEYDLHDLMCRNSNNIIKPEISITCSTPCDSNAAVGVTISWLSRGSGAGTLISRQKVALQYNRN